jgi:hypothetical protein
MKKTIEKIGPKEAGAILAIDNEATSFTESINEERIKHFAKCMKNGEWIDTGKECPPIHIGKDGVVIKGKTRLWAILESGMTFSFIVYRD